VITNRTKQPYRAPDSSSFFDTKTPPEVREYVDELLAPERLEEDGLFDAKAVGMLVKKARAGRAVGIKDNMALVGILSTQIVVERLVKSFDDNARSIDGNETNVTQPPALASASPLGSSYSSGGISVASPSELGGLSTNSPIETT